MVQYKEEIRKNKNLNDRIINELLLLGYDISHKGVKYFIEVIKYVYYNIDSLDNLEKYVYPIIVKKYNQTAYNVKSRINRSNTIMYYNCEIGYLKEYFMCNVDIKPKIKTVIIKNNNYSFYVFIEKV